MFTILTRTANRPKMFKRCRESILVQSLPAWHVVCSDDENDTYPEGDVVARIKRDTTQHRGHNLYLNFMRSLAHVDGPWVICLDDDDQFHTPNALKKIAAAINNSSGGENTIVLWQVKIGERTVPDIVPTGVPPFDFPLVGNVTGIGFCIHVKNWIDWQAKSAGDFTVMLDHYRNLTPVWIPETLTSMQSGPGGGYRIDH